MMLIRVSTVFMFLFFISCTKKTSVEKVLPSTNEVKYASAFEINNYPNLTVLKVTKPWPNASKGLTYVCAKNKALIPDSLKQYPFIQVPLKNIVVTSTTHISSMVNLNSEHTLKGFPHTEYISSHNVRKLIDSGLVKDLGESEKLNFEKTIDLKPHAIVALSIDDNVSAFEQFEKAGIPVIYNADWLEASPLGKAEWIKFFGVLFDKQKQATVFFNEVVKNYEDAKKMVATVKKKPTVISGGLYQDIWYAPQGESWMASFINDANGRYIWNNTKGTGSLAISLEQAMERGLNAEVWIGPSSFTSYNDLLKANPNYRLFKSVKSKNVYSYSIKIGATNGVLFYEEAPNRPDLVLKDFIYVLHPNLLQNYKPSYIVPLK